MLFIFFFWKKENQHLTQKISVGKYYVKILKKKKVPLEIFEPLFSIYSRMEIQANVSVVVPSHVLPHALDLECARSHFILRNNHVVSHCRSVLCGTPWKSSSSVFCRHPQLGLVRQDPPRCSRWLPSPPCSYTSATRVRRWRALLCLQPPNAKIFSLFCIHPPIICVFTHNRSRFVCLHSKFASLSYKLAAKSCSDWFTIGPTFPSSKISLSAPDKLWHRLHSDWIRNKKLPLDARAGGCWGRGYHAGSGGNCPGRAQPQQDPGEAHVSRPQSPGCQWEWAGELTCQRTAFWGSRLLLQLEGNSHLSLFQPLDQTGGSWATIFHPSLFPPPFLSLSVSHP